MPRDLRKSPRRIVVKVGSAVLARAGILEPASVALLVADLAACLHADPHRQIVLVSSGAVASGFRALGLDKPPKLIADKQAAAAVGQPRLMAEYAAAFAAATPPRPIAQVLLTAEDIDHRTRFLNARHTLERLLEAGVIPIINENDSVSFAEIKLGDNDRLSSLVASLIDADLLVILSSVSGVYEGGSVGAGRKPRIVPVIGSLAEALAHVAPDKSSVGTGGMQTKVEAACRAAALGIPTVIAGGDQPNIVQRLLAGEEIGTSFPAAKSSKAARKRWIGFSARSKGVLRVDDGARRALTTRGASLLPSGLKAVEGEFGVGGLVELAGPDGEPFARGLVSYPSDDLLKIRGRKAAEIEPILGYRYCDEVVHRDDLVILEEKAAADERG
jgi:glutamate 5-kinase